MTDTPTLIKQYGDKLLPSNVLEIHRTIWRQEKSQAQIAAEQGLSRSYVNKLAKDANRLYDLCDKYHVSPQELAEHLDREAWEAMMVILELDNLCRRRGYRGLDDETLAAQVDLYRRSL